MSLLKSLWGGSSRGQDAEDDEKKEEGERGKEEAKSSENASVNYWVKGLGGKQLYKLSQLVRCLVSYGHDLYTSPQKLWGRIPSTENATAMLCILVLGSQILVRVCCVF